MTPQTLPTDRPLTAGEPLWMVHVLGPDEIYPAPDHATAVEWCAGMNGAIPGSDVLCVAVPALWTGSSKDHAAGLKDARDDFSALARPATSAASEGEVGLDAIRSEIEEALDRNGLAERGWTQKAIDEAIAAVPTRSRFSKAEAGVVMPIIERILAALASPPVSERERELEGLFAALSENSWDLRCISLPTGGDDCDIGWRVVGHWQAQPCERTIAEVFHDDPAAAVLAALTAQPQEPV